MKTSHLITMVVGPLLLAACAGLMEPEEGAPPIPPSGSFILDVSDFQSTPLHADFAAAVNGQPGLTWGGAALTVGVWNTILAVTLVRPVASFVAALNQTPRWNDGRWVWEYNFNAIAAGFTARLEATPRTDGHDWSMFISGPGFESFNWFTGRSMRDGSGGSWSLLLSPDDPTPFLDIDWTHDAATNSGTIRYTNRIPGNVDQGGYVSFGSSMVDGYDRWYQIFAANANNTTDIQWQNATKDGRIRDPQRFGDPNWRCWDQNLDNALCS